MPNRDVKQLESKIQRKVLNYLYTVPCLYVVKVITASTRGVPDILCCWKSRFLAFEVKSKWNLTTAIQRYNLDDIIAAGGIGTVVRSVDDVKRILKEI